MAIKVRVEGVGILSFPDGTSRDVISDTVRRYASDQRAATIGRYQMASGAFLPPTKETIGAEAMDEAAEIQKEKMRDLGKASLRYGVPLAVALGTGGASIPIQIAAGAGSSLAGEAGAQTIEKLDEDQAQPGRP